MAMATLCGSSIEISIICSISVSCLPSRPLSQRPPMGCEHNGLLFYMENLNITYPPVSNLVMDISKFIRSSVEKSKHRNAGLLDLMPTLSCCPQYSNVTLCYLVTYLYYYRNGYCYFCLLSCLFVFGIAFRLYLLLFIWTVSRLFHRAILFLEVLFCIPHAPEHLRKLDLMRRCFRKMLEHRNKKKNN